MLHHRRFQPVTLDPTRLDQFHEYTHATLAQTIQEFVGLDGRSINTARWRLHRSRGDVSAFSDRRTSSAHLSSLLVAGTIPGRLVDVLEGLYMDTSESTRLVHRQLSTRFVDAEVLKVIEQRSSERPFAFTGVKWAMLKSSSSGITSSRDFCFFEKLGMIEIAGDRKLGFFVMQSVDIPECPPLTPQKIVRGDISVCYLFEELPTGAIGVYMRGSMESYVPQLLWKMARNSFADIAVSIGDVVTIAHAKRYLTLKQAKDRRGSSRLSHSIVCEVCRAMPSFFDHHQECAGCSKVSVCKRCRLKCDVFDSESAARRLVVAMFCVDCVTSVRSPPARKPVSPPRPVPMALRDHLPLNEPYTRASERAREVDERVRSDGSHVNSFHTITDDESSDEQKPDSQRSLQDFSLRLAQHLEDAGYSDSDACLRLTDLVTLGAGSIQQNRTMHGGDEEDTDQSEANCLSVSPASSAYSVGEVDSDEDRRGEPLTLDQEEVTFIRPLRRSTQPPEMLERQSLHHDGSIRLRSHAQSFSQTAPVDANDRARLMSRLVQATIAAEQTFRLTREQSRRANRVFAGSQGRAAEPW